LSIVYLHKYKITLSVSSN